MGNEWGHPTEGLSGATSATSALGALLSTQNHHAAGVHGKIPSRSSRYFSVDFGLTHLVTISLNGYNGVDLCTDECNKAQLLWLEQDLAAVDRTKTPWIVVMSHYPLYLTAEPTNSQLTEQDAAIAAQGTGRFVGEDWYSSEECEYEGHNANCTTSNRKQEQLQPKPGNMSANVDLEPLFLRYGVDIFWSGHIHYSSRFDGKISHSSVLCVRRMM